MSGQEEEIQQQIEEEQVYNAPLTEVISTTSGKLQGFKDEGNEVDVFLGIPYAQPPIGSLRFKPTVELSTPDEERLCIEHAPAAPQTTMPFDTLMCVQIDHQSEDCLYLNIWTPDTVKQKKRPVIVWFHPGACMRLASCLFFFFVCILTILTFFPSVEVLVSHFGMELIWREMMPSL